MMVQLGQVSNVHFLPSRNQAELLNYISFQAWAELSSDISNNVEPKPKVALNFEKIELRKTKKYVYTLVLLPKATSKGTLKPWYLELCNMYWCFPQLVQVANILMPRMCEIAWGWESLCEILVGWESLQIKDWAIRRAPPTSFTFEAVICNSAKNS